METSEVIAALALAISIAGLIYTHVQIQRTQIIQRAKLVKELYDEIFDDDEFAHIYSLLEQEERLFDRDRGTSRPDEQDRRQRGIERLLSKLESICAMYKSGLLVIGDLETFDYNIRRISQCEGFAEYRNFLENEWPDLRNLERGPFASLFWYLDTVPPIKSANGRGI